jgi:hypothetical protein
MVPVAIPNKENAIIANGTSVWSHLLLKVDIH